MLVAEAEALSRRSAQRPACFPFRLQPVNPFRQKKRGKSKLRLPPRCLLQQGVGRRQKPERDSSTCKSMCRRKLGVRLRRKSSLSLFPCHHDGHGAAKQAAEPQVIGRQAGRHRDKLSSSIKWPSIVHLVLDNCRPHVLAFTCVRPYLPRKRLSSIIP